MVRWLIVIGLIGIIGWQFINKPQQGLEVNSHELRDLLTKEPQPILIDVREPAEYKEVAIPGSVLIPLGELETSPKLTEIAKDAPIVMVCRSGRRSAFGQQILLDIGYNEVYNLTGGILEWGQEGY